MRRFAILFAHHYNCAIRGRVQYADRLVGTGGVGGRGDGAFSSQPVCMHHCILLGFFPVAVTAPYAVCCNFAELAILARFVPHSVVVMQSHWIDQQLNYFTTGFSEDAPTGEKRLEPPDKLFLLTAGVQDKRELTTVALLGGEMPTGQPMVFPERTRDHCTSVSISQTYNASFEWENGRRAHRTKQILEMCAPWGLNNSSQCHVL